MVETRYRRGDIVELLEGDGFIEAGAMGRVEHPAIETGPHAHQLRIEWFNDTLSFIQPRQVKLVVRPGPTTPTPVKIDAEKKTITGALK